MITLLRSLVFNVVFFGMTIGLSLYGVLFVGSEAGALALGRVWAQCGVWAAEAICGIRLEVSGGEHLPRAGPALIASQHQSAYDTMIWLLLVPRAAYVIKDELTRIPLFGPLTVRAGMIPIDRAAGSMAIRRLLRGADRAQRDGRQVVIFPEGTRSRPGPPQPLQHGIAAMSARMNLPVIPVRTDSGRCWGRRALAKYPGVVHVEVGAPLPPEPRAALMRHLQEALQPVDKPVGREAGGFACETRVGS